MKAALDHFQAQIVNKNEFPVAKIQRQTELLAEKVKESQNSQLGSEPQVEPPPPHY